MKTLKLSLNQIILFYITECFDTPIKEFYIDREKGVVILEFWED